MCFRGLFSYCSYTYPPSYACQSSLCLYECTASPMCVYGAITSSPPWRIPYYYWCTRHLTTVAISTMEISRRATNVDCGVQLPPTRLAIVLYHTPMPWAEHFGRFSTGCTVNPSLSSWMGSAGYGGYLAPQPYCSPSHVHCHRIFTFIPCGPPPNVSHSCFPNTSAPDLQIGSHNFS
jgi:hypothetical protein